MFGAVRSLLVPQRYTGANAAAADANARLSSQINSILCASRFAHHLKMKGRQMVGSYKTADEIERELQEWLTTYVNANVSSTGDSRARFPLVGGRVRVHELAGKPGSCGCSRSAAAALPARRRVGDVPTRHRSRPSLAHVHPDRKRWPSRVIARSEATKQCPA